MVITYKAIANNSHQTHFLNPTESSKIHCHILIFPMFNFSLQKMRLNFSLSKFFSSSIIPSRYPFQTNNPPFNTSHPKYLAMWHHPLVPLAVRPARARQTPSKSGEVRSKRSTMASADSRQIRRWSLSPSRPAREK